MGELQRYQGWLAEKQGTSCSTVDTKRPQESLPQMIQPGVLSHGWNDPRSSFPVNLRRIVCNASLAEPCPEPASQSKKRSNQYGSREAKIARELLSLRDEGAVELRFGDRGIGKEPCIASITCQNWPPVIDRLNGTINSSSTKAGTPSENLTQCCRDCGVVPRKQPGKSNSNWKQPMDGVWEFSIQAWMDRQARLERQYAHAGRSRSHLRPDASFAVFKQANSCKAGSFVELKASHSSPIGPNGGECVSSKLNSIPETVVALDLSLAEMNHSLEFTLGDTNKRPASFLSEADERATKVPKGPIFKAEEGEDNDCLKSSSPTASTEHGRKRLREGQSRLDLHDSPSILPVECAPRPQHSQSKRRKCANKPVWSLQKMASACTWFAVPRAWAHTGTRTSSAGGGERDRSDKTRVKDSYVPGACREARKPAGKEKCVHGTRTHRCPTCRPHNFCEHGHFRRNDSRCKECVLKLQSCASVVTWLCPRPARMKTYKPGEQCEHGRKGANCPTCSPKRYCIHNKRKERCKDCGGSQVCVHGKLRRVCRDCGGSAFCEHGKEKCKCRACGGSQVCEHGRNKHRCPRCNHSSLCAHGVVLRFCQRCRGERGDRAPSPMASMAFSDLTNLGFASGDRGMGTNRIRGQPLKECQQPLVKSADKQLAHVLPPVRPSEDVEIATQVLLSLGTQG